ncbi:hypothetical protein PhCBS80983_g03901 [Powellomyces hirtus]|uniref:HPP transmembrane region domain-containing protein n=1 Tax=Powellomyces hirtus TaxID=109895 RepID=A0A507DZW4_9FUNG|nr:hypothetical protein PhCBS80983_g03901 [Powellomyces hirtus]
MSSHTLHGRGSGSSLTLHSGDMSSSPHSKKGEWKRGLRSYGNAVLARPSRGILPGTPTLKELAATWVAAFLGIGSITSLHYFCDFFVEENIPLVIASFGATAVLIYATIESPLAQPRCVMGGHVLSALIGVSVQKVIVALADATGTDVLHWRSFGCAAAVAFAIAGMQLTKTTHPPGGATALSAVVGPEFVWNLGYLYVVVPVALGAAILLSIAVIVNNLWGRQYPQYWFYPTPLSRQHDVVEEVTLSSLPSAGGGPDRRLSLDTHALHDHYSVDNRTLEQIERFLEHEAAIGIGDGQSTNPTHHACHSHHHLNQDHI